MIPSPWTRRLVVAASLWAFLALRASLAGSAQTAAPPGAHSTVWSGVYNAEQAKRGEASANPSCAKRHNADLTRGPGGPGLLRREALDAWSTLTLGGLFGRVKTNIP